MLAKEKYGLRGREVSEHEATFIPFSAYTRMSGVDLDGRQLRKGRDRRDRRSSSASTAATVPPDFTEAVERISGTGGTPLAVADGAGCSASST